MKSKIPGPYYVVQIEHSTGIVLNPDRKWHLNNGEYRIFFRTEKEAIDFAHKTVNNYPEVECMVKSGDEKFITIIDKNGIRQ